MHNFSIIDGNEIRQSEPKQKYQDILKKEPELYDVYHLLMGKCAEWNMFAIMLRVDTNIRTTCESCTNNYLNLEKIIDSWIQARRDDCDVTWEMILDGLQKFQMNLLAKEVIDFLKKDKTIKKYMKKKDFFNDNYYF